MATQYVKFKGKCEWAKVWPHQIDREYEDEGKGGNWSIVVEVSDEDLKTFMVLSPKSEPKGNKIKLRRNEKHPSFGDLGPVTVTGVPEGTLIGNGSTVEVTVEAYGGLYKGKKAYQATRLREVEVLELVEYKPTPKEENLPEGPPKH